MTLETTITEATDQGGDGEPGPEPDTEPSSDHGVHDEGVGGSMQRERTGELGWRE